MMIGVCDGSRNGRVHEQICFMTNVCPLCQTLEFWDGVVRELRVEVDRLLTERSNNGVHEEATD